ncbi:MAG: ATP-binding protein, partial [Patescibacteria group bacterium]
MPQSTHIHRPRSDSLRDQLIAFHASFRGLSSQTVTFDLEDCVWTYPLMLLTLSAYLHEHGGSYTAPKEPRVAQYLRDVHFPAGVNRAADVPVGAYTVPIGFLQETSVQSREALESRFYDLIRRLTGNVAGADNAILYPISELVGNIFEHSGKDAGWIFAQHYPKKRLLDICIVDTGRGVAQSYTRALGKTMSHGEAIASALAGVSAKKAEGGRGYGLSTSQRVVCEALHGQFFFLTGDSVFFNTGRHSSIVQL